MKPSLTVVRYLVVQEVSYSVLQTISPEPSQIFTRGRVHRLTFSGLFCPVKLI